MSILTLDLETTIDESKSPDYLNPSNDVVLGCWRKHYWPTSEVHNEDTLQNILTCDDGMLVGHNLPFDIGWMLRKGWVTEEILAQRWTIWDTQLAHYLLTGHEGKFISLEELAKSHGIDFEKDPEIVEAFNKGVTPPIDKLRTYCAEDVKITEAIALHQMQEASDRVMLPLIMTQMDMRLVTAIMRVTGMRIDKKALGNCRDVCATAMLDCETDVALAMDDLSAALTHPVVQFLNPLKAPQLQTLLWGGDITRKERVTLPDRYKTGPRKGECKTRVETVSTSYPGMLTYIATSFFTNVPKNTEADTIQEVLSIMKHGLIKPMEYPLLNPLQKILEIVLQYREAKKIHSTYVKPTELKEVLHGRVHPTIHMTSTNTGRTSCADPNLQNVPVGSFGNYRRCLIADEGYELVEFDYNQLEVVVAGVLSGDRQLLSDVLSDDVHSQLYKGVYGKPPTAEERRQFKRVVFAAFYGAGVRTLADHGDITLKESTKFLDTFNKRYPKYREYKERLKTYCEKTGYITNERIDNIQIRHAIWKSPTGRRYVFKQKVGKDYHTGEPRARWSDQQIANYPVQGTATADIVPMMVGYTWRQIRREFSKKEVEFIMTVHDSLLVEIAKGRNDIAKKIGELLSNVPVLLLDTFGMDVGSTQFEVGCKTGINWEDMKEEK